MCVGAVRGAACVWPQSKMSACAVRVQKWFRGHRVLVKFQRWSRRRRAFKHNHFLGWKFVLKGAKFGRYQLKLRAFNELRTEAAETKQVGAPPAVPPPHLGVPVRFV